MLRGYRGKHGKAWRLAFALAGAALVAGLSVGWGLSQQAEYEWQAQHKGAEHARYARDYIRDRCVSMPVLDKIDCATKARDEHRAYQRDEQDLVAQKTSALWTMIMGWAATFGMVLSAVGVYLVWTTFAETRTANNIAREGNRAWVGIEAGPRARLSITPDRLKFETDVIVHNFGNSPALDVWSDGLISFSPPDRDKLKRIIETRGPDAMAGHTILFPEKPEGGGLVFDFVGEKPDSGTVYATVFVKYRTVGTKVWHLTAFTYVTKPDEAATRLFGMVGNELRLNYGELHQTIGLALHKGLGGFPLAT